MTGKLDLTADALLSTTRAVRRRLDLSRPVPPELVEECLELALQAPSGSNTQTWHFVVVTDPAIRAKIADVYRRAFADYAAGPMNTANTFAEDPARHAAQGRVFDSARYLAEHLHEVPCLVIPVAKGRCERLESAHRQAIYWASIVPAVWSFMLAARERGLGTSWTTMHLRYERDVADILGIPFDAYTQVALIPTAFTPGHEFKRGPRQPLDEVLHIDGW